MPDPSWEDTTKVTGDYAALYWWEDLTPTGRPVTNHVTLFRISDNAPTESEVEARVFYLHLNKAGGHTHLRPELRKYPISRYVRPVL